MGEIKYRSENDMKDSGVEWVKQIPREWNMINIGKLGKINTSSVNKKIVKGEKIINLLNYLDIYRNSSKEINSEIDYMKVSANQHQRISSQIHLGDVIFTPSSETFDDIGHSAVVVENLDNTLFSYHVVRLSFNKYVDLNYKKYLFNNHITMNQFSKKATGTTRKTLGKDDFRYSYVFLPTNNEQKKISNFLDIKTTELDQVISKKEKLIEKLEEAKKSLISEVVTGKVNIVNGKLMPRDDSEMIYSGVKWLGSIPRDWEIKRLKHILREPMKYGANESADLDDKKLPRYIRITDFGNNGQLRNDTFKSLEHEKAANFMLSEGDILFARSGATVGKTFQFKNYKGKACFAGYLIKAVVDKTIIASDFLYYFTKSLNYENWKNSIFIQATIQNIGADKYQELKLIVPSLDEQTRILKYLDTETLNISNTIKEIKLQIQKLTQAKKSLISEAVTGKIDLRDWEIIEEGEVE